MNRKQLVSLILCCLMLCACLCGCAPAAEPAAPAAPGAEPAGQEAPAAEPAAPADPAAEPANTDPVVVYAPNIFTSMNPYATIGVSDDYVFKNVYETLFRVDREGNIVPMLAESYTVSEDGLVYTVKLIQNAVFHDGTALKASDVAFTYTYAQDFPSRKSFYGTIASVKALDDYTVEFTLSQITPMFLSNTQSMPIMSEKFVGEAGEAINETTCGTGPYKVVSYDPAVNCILVANEEYRNGAPSIKNAEIRYVSDSSSAVVSLEAGEIDIMSVPTSAAGTFKDRDGYTLEVATPLHTAVVALNVTKAPFDNKLVRQALTYATDKQSIVIIAYDGYAVEARLQANTNSFGVDFSEATDFSYDPEKAKALLAEAGYPDGFDLADFGIHMDVIAGGYHEKIAQVFQQNLADVGVKVELVATETPDEMAKAGDFAIMNEGLSYRFDFSFNQAHYTTAGIGGTNFSQMSDPYVDEMFKKGDEETDPEARKAIYKELINYLVDYCPSIPIFHKQTVFVWNNKLNAKIDDNPNNPYYIFDWSWN